MVQIDLESHLQEKAKSSAIEENSKESESKSEGDNQKNEESPDTLQGDFHKGQNSPDTGNIDFLEDLEKDLEAIDLRELSALKSKPEKKSEASPENQTEENDLESMIEELTQLVFIQPFSPKLAQDQPQRGIRAQKG